MRFSLPDVAKTIAVASGKGGVGKTTVTVNLALALQQCGAQVGIFDADIYGPNVPLMLGVHQRRRATKGYVSVARPRGSPPYIKPLERFGLKLMSTGLLLSEEQVINPPPGAVGRIVLQMLQDVIWDKLDYLLLDLPPSAGQPQEDLVKWQALDGVIIVTTPQDLSLLDSARSFRLYQEAQIPVLGIVENMSTFVCPACGEAHEVFQRSEKWRPAALANTPLLGRIPLTQAISQGINRAHPLLHERPDSPQAEAFVAIARQLMGKERTP